MTVWCVFNTVTNQLLRIFTTQDAAAKYRNEQFGSLYHIEQREVWE